MANFSLLLVAEGMMEPCSLTILHGMEKESRERLGLPYRFEVLSRRDIANIEKQSLIVSRFALVRDNAIEGYF